MKSACRWALCAALAATVYACAGEDPGEVVVAGADADEPELVEYLQELRRDIALAPASASLRGRLAMAYHANGFHAAAAATYAQAERLDPDDPSWPYLHALALAAEERLDEALEKVGAALALDRSLATARLWRGEWLLQRDELDAAEEAFAGAADASPHESVEVAARVGLARVWLRQDRLEDVVSALEPLVARYGHAAMRLHLGNAYRRLGRQDDADRTLDPISGNVKQLRWLDPLEERVHEHVRGYSGRMQLAKRRLIEQRPDAAAALLEPLRRRFAGDRDVINNLHIAYRQLGRGEEAFALLEEGLAAHPGFDLFHYNYAVMLEARGRVEEALAHLDSALRANPALAAAHERKFAILSAAGEHERALGLVDALAGGDAASAGLLYDAGMLAGAREQWQRAIDFFGQALVRDPGLGRAQLFLAHALREAGRLQESRDALGKAAELGVAAAEIDRARLLLAEREAESAR